METQGNGGVLGAEAVETQGEGSVLDTEVDAVGTQGKGSVLATKDVETQGGLLLKPSAWLPATLQCLGPWQAGSLRRWWRPAGPLRFNNPGGIRAMVLKWITPPGARTEDNAPDLKTERGSGMVCHLILMEQEASDMSRC